MVKVLSTKSAVIELRINNPFFSSADIGTKIGVSRERVRQILKEAELPTRGQKLCSLCGKERQHALNYQIMVKRKCISLCTECALIHRKKLEEKRKKQWITLKCDYCHTPFKRRTCEDRKRKKTRKEIHILYKTAPGFMDSGTFWAYRASGEHTYSKIQLRSSIQF